jgi:hypothetical protein
MNYRYKESGVWLQQVEPDHGLCDCIAEGSMMAYAFNDYDVLEVHADLLRAGLRWPSHMSHSFRSIHSLTRDPFVAYWFACWKMDRKDFIILTKLPWWLRRRYAHAYWKYLASKLTDKKQLRITEGLRVKTFNSKYKLIKQLHHRFGINAYSLHLWCLMAHTADSEIASYELSMYVPSWNLWCWLLLYIDSISEDEIFDYKAVKGYNWTSHYLRTDRPLDKDDEFPLDKQLLKRLAFGN